MLQNPGQTGFLQGFTRSAVDLTRLGLAFRQQEQQEAAQRESIKRQQQMLKGQQAARELRQEQVRQQLQQRLQRNRLAAQVTMGGQGPTQAAAMQMTPERALAGQAIREGQIGTATKLLTSPGEQVSPLAQAVIEQPGFYQSLGSEQRAQVLPELVRAGISPEAAGQLTPSIRGLPAEVRAELFDAIRTNQPIRQQDIQAATQRITQRNAQSTAFIRSSVETAVREAERQGRVVPPRSQQRLAAFNEVLGLTEALEAIANETNAQGVRNIDRWVTLAGGNVARLRNFNDPAFQEFEAISQRLLDTIARERTGAVIGENEEQRFRRFVPTVDARTINQFQQRLNSLKGITTATMDQEYGLIELPASRRMRMQRVLEQARGRFRDFSRRQQGALPVAETAPSGGSTFLADQ